VKKNIILFLAGVLFVVIVIMISSCSTIATQAIWLGANTVYELAEHNGKPTSECTTDTDCMSKYPEKGDY
jgi:hypothetical protein